MNQHEFHEYVKSEGKFAKVTTMACNFCLRPPWKENEPCSESRKPVADNLWKRNNA